MNEEALSLEAELSDEGIDALQQTLEERMTRDAERSPVVAEVQEAMATSARQLIREVEAANRMSLFVDANPANQAQASARAILDVDPARQARRKARQLERSLPMSVIDEAPELVQEDMQARGSSRWSYVAAVVVLHLLVLCACISFFVFIATIAMLARGSRARQSRFSALGDSDPSFVGHFLQANQAFLSLMMQAAADRPVDFSAFGISEQVYAALRASLCDERDNIGNDVWWGMLADHAGTIYPPTGSPLTLGDHFLALDFAYDLYEPLYDPQPLELDVNAVITSLADRIDFNHPLPVQGLYRSVCELIPDDTGANRLQQIVLAQSAIARAIARRAKPVGS